MTIAGTSATHLAWVSVLLLLTAVPISVSAWALLDAAHRPSWAWALAGRHQVAWMAAVMFGVLTVIGGLAISLWYLLKVRPVVAAAERGDVPL